MKELFETYNEEYLYWSNKNKWVIKELFETQNDDYLCWKEQRDEYELRWQDECRACYLGCCESPACGNELVF